MKITIIPLLFLLFGYSHNSSKGQIFSLNDFSTLYSKGLIEGESSDFIKAFSDDVKIFPEYNKAHIGLENVEEYFTSIFEKYDITEYKRSIIEELILGERRVEMGTFEITFEARESNASHTLPGTYMDIWDISSEKPELLTLAWNYDIYVPGIEQAFQADDDRGVHWAYEPVAPINDPISNEVAALNYFDTVLMQRRQPETLALKYGPDAWYAPHNGPLVKGREAIKDFLVEYASNWPTFDYIDVNAHIIYAHSGFVIEHMSYQLRWRSNDHSGVNLGKGIRISKRNEQGVLQVYRSIAMHD